MLHAAWVACRISGSVRAYPHRDRSAIVRKATTPPLMRVHVESQPDPRARHRRNGDRTSADLAADPRRACPATRNRRVDDLTTSLEPGDTVLLMVQPCADCVSASKRRGVSFRDPPIRAPAFDERDALCVPALGRRGSWRPCQTTGVVIQSADAGTYVIACRTTWSSARFRPYVSTVTIPGGTQRLFVGKVDSGLQRDPPWR